MAASRELTLTEELFRATQLNKYKETISPIMSGSGLPEKMFEGSQHTANYAGYPSDIQSEQMEKR